MAKKGKTPIGKYHHTPRIIFSQNLGSTMQTGVSWEVEVFTPLGFSAWWIWAMRLPMVVAGDASLPFPTTSPRRRLQHTSGVAFALVWWRTTSAGEGFEVISRAHAWCCLLTRSGAPRGWCRR
jgi:hypothetical protein